MLSFLCFCYSLQLLLPSVLPTYIETGDFYKTLAQTETLNRGYQTLNVESAIQRIVNVFKKDTGVSEMTFFSVLPLKSNYDSTKISFEDSKILIHDEASPTIIFDRDVLHSVGLLNQEPYPSYVFHFSTATTFATYDYTDFDFDQPQPPVNLNQSSAKSIREAQSNYLTNWIQLIPGGVFGVYNLVFLDKNQLDVPNIFSSTTLGYFARNTWKIAFCKISITPQKTTRNIALSMILNDSNDEGSSYQTTEVDCGRDVLGVLEGDSKHLLFPERPNWNLASLVTNVQPDGDQVSIQSTPEVKLYETMDNFVLATFSHLSVYLNASQKFKYVFETPPKGQLESGSWGGYIDPLIAGVAHLCTLMEPSYLKPRLIFTSRAMLFDYISFITALPRERTGSVFEALIYPFDVPTWACLLISFFGVFLAFHLTQTLFHMHLSGNTNSKLVDSNVFRQIFMGSWSTSLFITFEPILGQPGDFGKTFNTKGTLDSNRVRCKSLSLKLKADKSGNNFSSRKWDFHRFFIIWTACLMILSSYYTSKLISAVVMPYYEYLPRNFYELLTSPSVAINAVFYFNNIQRILRDVNDSASRNLLSRTKEVSWNNISACFLDTLNWNSVCLGHNIIIQNYAVIHLTGRQRQSLFRKSEDTLFPYWAALGVSREFPDVQASLDHIIKRLEPSGLYIYWFDKNLNNKKSLAKHVAVAVSSSKTMNGSLPWNNADETGKTSTTSKLVNLFGKTVGYGLILSLLGFILEFLIYFVSKERVFSIKNFSIQRTTGPLMW